MQKFYDFLSFKFFISPIVLVVFYYIGALGVPVSSWIFTMWVKRKYWVASDIYESGKNVIVNITSKKDRVRFAIVFTLIFIFLEIIWRMIFEFLIAYLQMRDALIKLAQ